MSLDNFSEYERVEDDKRVDGNQRPRLFESTRSDPVDLSNISDDRALCIVHLQPISKEPRAVSSGFLIEGLNNPYPYLGTDPSLAGKYALLEAAATATQTALASEAISIGLKAGLDSHILYEAIASAAGSSWSFRQHGEEMLGLGSPKPGQTFEEADEALETALNIAAKNKLYAPLFTLAKQAYTAAAGKGKKASAEISSTWTSTSTSTHGVSSQPLPRAKCHKVGFVGLGAMGLGMAQVLHSANINVVGYDAWKPSSERYKEAGGVVAADMMECATDADVFLLMVINAEQAEQVLFEQKALYYLPVNSTVLLMSTVSPSQAQVLAQAVSAVRPDVAFVDAPVSGGTPRAASGDLTILASGLPKDASRVLSVLDLLSGSQGHPENLFIIPGGAGMGAAVKVVNQHLAGSHIACTAEILAFAASMKLPLRQVRELLLSGPAQTWMMGHRGKHMMDGLLQPPTSTINIFVKDTSIVATEARRLRCPAPMIAIVQQHFIQASACGWGLDDDSSMVRLWKASGINVATPA